MRELANNAEEACRRRLRECAPSKRGWPDFSFFHEGDLYCVEVKPKAGRLLKRDQQRVMDGLAEHGVPCFVWTPDTGFIPWTECERVQHHGEERVRARQAA